jgi:hypothetical protein
MGGWNASPVSQGHMGKLLESKLISMNRALLGEVLPHIVWGKQMGSTLTAR